MSLTPLTRPLVRRIAALGLVVRLEAGGVTLRGYGRRNGRHVSWERLCSLLESDGKAILIEAERTAGARNLEAIRGRKGDA